MNKKTLIPLSTAFLLVVAIGVVLLMKDFSLSDNKNKTEGEKKQNVFKSEVIVKEDEKRYFKKDFEDFDNLEKFNGKISEVQFTTNTRSWQVSSTVSDIVKKGPNFAGKHAVSTWVCGQECQRSSIIDVSTGDVLVDGIRSVYDVKYRVSSRLFIVNPPQNIPESEVGEDDVSTQYYKLKDNKLKFIGENDVGSREESCAQIVTKAKNEATGEVLNFPTPCDVPTYGWEQM